MWRSYILGVCFLVDFHPTYLVHSVGSCSSILIVSLTIGALFLNKLPIQLPCDVLLLSAVAVFVLLYRPL